MGMNVACLDLEGVAEDSRPAELFHKWRSELSEGIADDDSLANGAELIEELFSAGHRVDLSDSILNLLKSESVLLENSDSPIH